MEDSIQRVAEINGTVVVSTQMIVDTGSNAAQQQMIDQFTTGGRVVKKNIDSLFL